MKTVPSVDLKRFSGSWFVIGGRLTPFEDGAHNAVETYKLNPQKDQIDVSFTYNDGSFNGELKEITQTAWIEDSQTKAHWLISPFWPLKFDYLIIALDPNYQWTAVGVPNQSYLWILSRSREMVNPTFEEVLDQIAKTGYRTDEVILVPQKKS